MDDMPPKVTQRVNVVFAKVIGGVVLWIGIAALALLVWFSYGLIGLNRKPELFIYATLSVLAIVGTFCLTVGWRLFLNRPNRFGSILGPLGWRVLGALFGVFATGSLVLAIALLSGAIPSGAIASDEPLTLAVTSVVSCTIFCHWCFWMAQNAATQGRAHGAL